MTGFQRALSSDCVSHRSLLSMNCQHRQIGKYHYQGRDKGSLPLLEVLVYSLWDKDRLNAMLYPRRLRRIIHEME